MGVLDKIQKGTLPVLIALSALSVSASAAFYSVSGLSKLFAGAAFEVTIMAASLEVAKLVVASLLYQYWSTINKFLRTYLTIATLILVLITSMGIYGFLSAAYQDTYRQLTIKNNQTAFLTQKKDFYNKDVIRYDQELERISNNISTLSNAKVSNIQVRDTTVSSGFRSTISTTELRLSQKRIEVEEKNRQKVQTKREVAADSLQKYQIEILTLENNSKVAGELGPLQYLSGLTGTSMDKIINILLLVIIFVFDPLAISLVVAANFAFSHAFPKKKYRENLYGEKVEVEGKDSKIESLEETLDNVLDDISNIEVKDSEEIISNSEFFNTLDIIEEKIEDEEYHELDIDKDGKISENEIRIAKAKISQLKEILEAKSLSSWRTNRIRDEIEKLESVLPDDDLTITY